jgi:aspartate aminotransferase-like enzyme
MTVMNPSAPLTVKIATEGWEFDQIHALNHQTFAEEIPQHPTNDAARLVDRFHRENTYVVGLSGRRLVGMIAIRDRRPFSLDQRLPDLDAYLPPGRSMCELRLLAVEKGQRASRVLPALLDFVWRHCLAQGYDLALISAVTTQLKLYRHVGFEPFGPLTGTPGAQFQPMLLTLEQFAVRAPRAFRGSQPPHVANFLPGPVAIEDAVASALQRPPVSHRSPAFMALLESVKTALCGLVGAERVELFVGNGTMANDVIAGQLTLEGAPGIVLINGEFGKRLQDHAHRAGLTFDTVELPWGRPFEPAAVAACLARSSARWLWFPHCETSTGVLNDLDAMRPICAAAGVKLCVDAISSIGTTPVSLEGVYLASCVSGKGLGSFPGISMVFYDHDVSPSRELPRSLDLGLYAREGGVPFTHSSNLLRSLDAALQSVDWPARFRTLTETSDWLRRRLVESGFDIVGSTAEPSPGVVTVALPAHLNSVGVAIELERQGYLVSANSRYLVERNWIQICAMGNVSRDELSAVIAALGVTCGDRAITAP